MAEFSTIYLHHMVYRSLAEKIVKIVADVFQVDNAEGAG